MTRIDFYLLAQGEEPQRLELACRLTEKAWRHGFQVWIQAADAAMSARLDKLLWSFREDSFIPHAPAPGMGEPVLIGLPEQNIMTATGQEQLLIQLAPTLPDNWKSCSRVAELVSDEAAIKTETRAHYRYYQTEGITPHLHHLRGGA